MWIETGWGGSFKVNIKVAPYAGVWIETRLDANIENAKRSRLLWLSTPNGLAVYNGEEVEILNKSTGLLTHGQRSVSSHGEIIIASSDLGLNILDAKTLNVLNSVNTVEQALGWCQCRFKDVNCFSQ